MEARFEGARLVPQEDGFWLSVKPLREDLPKVRRWLMEKHTGTQSLTVKQYRKKRSLTANAYAWVLLDKLAEVIGLPKEEIYRETIRNMGGISFDAPVPIEQVEPLMLAWPRGHTGRMCEDLGPNPDDPKERYVRFVYGSSDYDVTQMARFIDLLVQECAIQGIETMSDQERSLLLEAWDAQTD